MNLTQLHHVIMVYQIGSFSGAAKVLYLSQSALSKSIATLESELGNPIFTRHYHGIKLTPFGEQFMRYAEDIATKEKLILKLASGHEEKDKPVFKVAADYLRFASYAYVQVVQRHTSMLLDLCFLQRDNSGVLLEVINGNIDIGVIRSFTNNMPEILQMIENSGLVYHSIVRCPTWITLNADHPLCQNNNTNIITPEQLRPYPFRVISEPMRPFYNMQTMYAQSLGAESLLEGDFDYRDGSMTLENDAYLCVAELSYVYERLGLDPVNDINCRTFCLPSFPIEQEIGWICHKDATLSFIEEDYISMLQSICSID